ncbi:MAG: hypothetical protein CMI13_11195 [Oleibacter sp.]|nr:hypothetical protein [Thalassolituus sp.]|tara:strand:- start:204 stop:605 length:402 start_codon:yes stop_codon:yes gene_type:complete
MALTADRNTPSRDGHLIEVAVAASTVIHAGSIVCANAAGFAVPATTATGLTYLGRAEAGVDNSNGAAGDATVTIHRRHAFKWENSATDAIDQSGLGKTCYLEDDQTVAATNGSSTRSAGGVVIGIEPDGVWVE